MNTVNIPLWAARYLAADLQSESAASVILSEAIVDAATTSITPRMTGLLGRRCIITDQSGGAEEAVLIVDKPEAGTVEVAVASDLPGGAEHTEVPTNQVLLVASAEETIRDIAAGWKATWERLSAVDEQADPWVQALGHAADTIEVALND